MKKLPVENLGFTEIGGVGEMIYRAVRFPEYVPEYDENSEEQVIRPMFTFCHQPTSGTDYSITGQDLLANLCNLYKKINAPDSTIHIVEAVWDWCRNNIHPYNIDALCEMIDEADFMDATYWDLIRMDATFSVNRFIKDLCNLGTVFEAYFALHRVNYYKEVSYGRELYYEGRICDSMAFLEKYRKYEDDAEYLKHVKADYNNLMATILDMFPDFRMRLKVNQKTGKIEYGADVQSVFDICWYAFSRKVADVAPPADTDLNFMFSQGSILSCMMCGKYFVRHSSPHRYCSDSCKQEARRQSRRNCYARKKAAEAENKE